MRVAAEKGNLKFVDEIIIKLIYYQLKAEKIFEIILSFRAQRQTHDTILFFSFHK